MTHQRLFALPKHLRTALNALWLALPSPTVPVVEWRWLAYGATEIASPRWRTNLNSS